MRAAYVRTPAQLYVRPNAAQTQLYGGAFAALPQLRIRAHSSGPHAAMSHLRGEPNAAAQQRKAAQGPFLTKRQTQALRYRPLRPTLRVMTDYDCEDKQRRTDMAAEWVMRVQPAPFAPATHVRRGYARTLQARGAIVVVVVVVVVCCCCCLLLLLLLLFPFFLCSLLRAGRAAVHQRTRTAAVVWHGRRQYSADPVTVFVSN